MTSCWRSQSRTSVSNSDFEIDRPALLTTMSTPPKASSDASSAAAIWASSVTSQATLTAPSVVPISRATASALPASMSATMTHAPSAARRWAMARPIPEPPPVTNATRVASGLGLGRRASLASSSAQYSMRNFSDSGIGAYVLNRLGAAHDVDRVDVELAGDPRGLLVRPEAEHADARNEDDRRVGTAHRRRVGRRVPLVVGRGTRRGRPRGARGSGPRALRTGRTRAGRRRVAAPSFVGSGRGMTSRAQRAWASPRERRSRARHRCR